MKILKTFEESNNLDFKKNNKTPENNIFILRSFIS